MRNVFHSRWAHLVSGAVLTALVVAVPMRVLAQSDELDDDLEFEPDDVDKKDGGKKGKPAEPPPDDKPPSKTLERAIKLYDKKDYYSSSIELNKVLAGESGDSAANKQRAEFFMGKTLYQMKYYAGALSFFSRITDMGTGHRYYQPTLKWLAALSRVLPETSGILDKIGKYDVTDLEQPVMDEVRDELYYLLGRHFYSRGKFEKAIELFNTVKDDSPFYVKAKFFEGVTYVRQYKGKPAVEAFKALLVIGEERERYSKIYGGAEIRQFEELARLQLARVFYSTQQYDTSIRYYEKIPQDSPEWANTLFEASWAYFMKTNFSKALGNIHSLNAPYFENEFYPESMLLAAVIYFEYCLYDQALEMVAEYDAKYRPLRKALTEVLKKYDDNAEFYGYVKQIMADKAGLAESTARLVKGTLSDRTLRKTFAWVEELDRELKSLDKADQAWKQTQIANEVLTELTLQKSEAEADAGKLARERIKRLEEELRQLANDGTKIKIETLEAAAGKISAEAAGAQIKGGGKAEAIVVDDEHFMWKFNGEYWKDELGFYRFKIASKCAKKK